MRASIIFLYLIGLTSFAQDEFATTSPKPPEVVRSEIIQKGRILYSQIQGAAETVSEKAFVTGYLGHQLLIKNQQIQKWPELGIIDMDKPSHQKRFLVVDLNSRQALISTAVAHGKNSGGSYAKHFSNQNNSRKSSLGFYLGVNSYNGKHGYSLRYNGLDSNYNSNLMTRSIVLHKAWYVDKNSANGRSWGCTAVNRSVSKRLVDTLKNGRVVYVHHKTYDESRSSVLRSIATDSSPPSYRPTNRPSGGLNSEDNNEPPSFKNLSQFKGIAAVTLLAGGGAILSGGKNYKKCQENSNSEWSNVVAAASSGHPTDKYFRSSWGDTQNQIEHLDGDVTIDHLIDRSTKHLKTIKDCTALAAMSTNTNFDKENIDSQDRTDSIDRKLTCQYKNSQSQDYEKCTQLLSEYNKAESQIQKLKNTQTKTFSNIGKKTMIELSGSKSIQSDSISKAGNLTNIGNKMSQEAARLDSVKISILKAVRDTLPNKNSLIQKCRIHMNTITQTLNLDYLAFTSQFNNNISIVPQTGDSCERMYNQEKDNLIQNQNVKHQANEEILKTAKKGSDEYEAALRYKDQTYQNEEISNNLERMHSGLMDSKTFFANDSKESTNSEKNFNESESRSINREVNNRHTNSKMNTKNTQDIIEHGDTGEEYATQPSNNKSSDYRKTYHGINNSQIKGDLYQNKDSLNGHETHQKNGIYNESLAKIENRNLNRSESIHSENGSSHFQSSIDIPITQDIESNKEKNIFEMISMRYYKKKLFLKD